MGTSNGDIIKSIQNYQERLDRYVSNKNEDKMLYVVKKLDQLPINTSHLENTGVGRTVNALKKLEGKVGEAAKELVASWKDMVLREEKASQENARAEPEDDVDSVYSSDHEGDNLCVEENISSRNILSNSNAKSDRYNEYAEDANSTNSKRVNSDGSEICSETEQEVEHQFASSPKEKASKKRHHSTDRGEDGKTEKHKSKKAKKDHRHEDEYKRESKSKSDKKSTKESSHKTNNEFKKSSKDNPDESSRHKSEKRKKDSGKDEKSHRRSDNKESHSSNSDSKNDVSKRTESKSKSHREKSSESKKSKHREEYSTDIKSTSSKEHSREHKSHKKSKIEKSANKDKIVNGIGSESGASFAEALGMCEPKTATSSSKKKPASSTSSDKYRNSSSLETETSAGSTSMASSSHRRSDPAQQEAVPELLKEKELEPLNINISSLLPEITPNYRPLGINFDQQPKRVMTDDEALSRVMSNRNQRTKVYSGNKSFGKVESLFQICVRILQDNIDALEYTGGVPYIILKPILERATPDQLFNMEHHNPYLIEDTDDLWSLHCQKEFRNKKREELESWREMYMRCLDEREARLNAITANIKQSQDKSIPIRTTKLAYVDSVVKPPRNVARQQAKNGISFDKKHISTSAKLSAIAKSGEAGKIAVPNPGSRGGGERSSSSAAMKPKKAPLMAKTLSFLKNRFKR